jgi:preprotein translocase subunit SecA
MIGTVPTNQPLRRLNHPDLVFRSDKEKWDAVVNDIEEMNRSGRPILALQGHGEDVTSVKIANSYFLKVGSDGTIIHSTPKIIGHD